MEIEQWRSIVTILAKIIPFYERMNHVMSLGKDVRYRAFGISHTLSEGDIILDVGSGPGTMVDTAFKIGFNPKQIMLLDALPEMLQSASYRLASDKVNPVVALFEHIPFRDNCFDVIMGGYAFRDALNLHQAFKETIRVLKHSSGRLLIVDLGKPDNPLFNSIITVYWKLCVPFIALIILGKKGKMYSKIYMTYKRLPKNSELKSLLERHFRQVSFVSKLFGGVIIIKCSAH